MTARLAPTIRRWIDRAKNVALLGAVGAGCAYGYAFAVAPTVNVDRTFLGSVNLLPTTSNVLTAAYVVPAGQQLTITDIVLGNAGSLASRANMYIGNGGCTEFSVVARLGDTVVPPSNTVDLSFLTGFGFGPGKTVCVTSTISLSWTIRGYLSPAT